MILRETKGAPLTHQEMDSNFKYAIFPPYVHIQEQLPSETRAGRIISGWQKRNINTVLINNIDNSSLNNNQIILPKGKYYIDSNSTFTAYDESNTGRISLYDVNNNIYLLHGANATASNSIRGRAGTILIVSGYFELENSTNLELHIYSRITGNMNYSLGLICSIPNEPEIYTEELMEQEK